ncbi:MAG: hypothetical protein RIK87_25505 [Fuerstiella sp.]
MFSSPSLCLRALLLLGLSAGITIPATAKVEAVKGKRYQLNEKHGPWMIMVAALRDVPEERRIEGGMSAWEAADQLVYELRKVGIPAYTFLQRMELTEVKGYSGGADDHGGKYISRHEAIAVLAGNFPSPDERQAKLILEYVKNRFEPAFMKDKSSGAILPRTPGRPKPLSRAHMTTNPLMSAAQIRNRTVDPLIRQLNADMEYSIFKNKGKYTLRVATFKGNAILQVGNRVQESVRKNFDKIFGSNLDEAGTKAWEMTHALRSASRLGYDRDYEAYVYHDRHASYVTIGSFNSPEDPRIAHLVTKFNGKARMHEGQEVLTAEAFTIPRNVSLGQQPDKFWMFDVRPKLIEVPSLSQ